MRHRHIMEMRSEMKYIESLREGERINEIYLCKVKQIDGTYQSPH